MDLVRRRLLGSLTAGTAAVLVAACGLTRPREVPTAAAGPTVAGSPSAGARSTPMAVPATTSAVAPAVTPAAAVSATGGLVQPDDIPELETSQGGTLAGNPGGAFVNFRVSVPTGEATTLSLTYRPFDVAWAHAVGFKVWQMATVIASATGQSAQLGDATDSPTATATFTPSANGGPIIVQVFNNSPTTITYTLAQARGAAAAGPAASTTLPPSTALPRYVYVGTYTSTGKAEGIYVYKLAPENGGLIPVQIVPTRDPSFLALDPDLKYLYCVNQEGLADGSATGRVSAFALDPATGKLSPLNDQPTRGSGPGHLAVHPSGNYLLASNYGSGNFVVYRLLADGSIGAMTDDVRDAKVGTGANATRQDGSHPDMITTDPSGAHVFGVDLGTDKIMIWELNPRSGTLSPNTVPYAQVASGSGCRHLAFHPSGAFVYVVNEIASSVTAFAYDASRGALNAIQSISAVPPDFTGTNISAEIRVHPTGNWVYATNRGHDSVAMFAVTPASGRLTSLGWQPSGGASPRGMNLDPSGTYLFTGNQDSDNIGVFRVDPRNGKLLALPAVPSPVPVDIEFGPTI